MAISGFGKGKEGSTTSSAGPAAGGFGNLTAFIDQGSEFEGKLSFKDTVRIDGTFSGVRGQNSRQIANPDDIFYFRCQANQRKTEAPWPGRDRTSKPEGPTNPVRT